MNNYDVKTLDLRIDKILHASRSRKCIIEIQYIHINKATSEAIFFCSGMGLDYRDFLHHIDNYDGHDLILYTPFGFEPAGKLTELRFSLDDHAELIAEFIKKMVTNHSIGKATLVGFSTGADMVSLALTKGLLPSQVAHCVLLDPNIDASSLTFSTFVAEFMDKEMSIVEIQSFIEKINFEELRSWANVHAYIAEIIKKFHGERIRYLAYFANSVVEKFKTACHLDFAKSLRHASGAGSRVSLIFSGDYCCDKVTAIKKGLEKCGEGNLILCEQKNHCNHFDLIDDNKIVRSAILMDDG